MATTIENLFESTMQNFRSKSQMKSLTSKSQKFPNLLVAHHWLPTLGVAFGEELFQKNRRKFKKKNGFFEVKLDFVDDFCFVTFKEFGCYVMFLVIFSKSLGWPSSPAKRDGNRPWRSRNMWGWVFGSLSWVLLGWICYFEINPGILLMIPIKPQWTNK